MTPRTLLTFGALLIVVAILNLLAIVTKDPYFIQWSLGFALVFFLSLLAWSIDQLVDNGFNPF